MRSPQRRTIGLAIVLAAIGSRLGAQTAAPAPQVTVGGLVHTQFTYQDVPVHFDNFDVKRAYINVIGRSAGGL